MLDADLGALSANRENHQEQTGDGTREVAARCPTPGRIAWNQVMFPQTRLRRLRYHPAVRNLVRETDLAAADFILPYFVRPGKNVKNEIASRPGNYQLSVDRLVDEVGKAVDLGIRAFIFFGIPASKDPQGAIAWHEAGI